MTIPAWTKSLYRLGVMRPKPPERNPKSQTWYKIYMPIEMITTKSSKPALKLSMVMAPTHDHRGVSTALKRIRNGDCFVQKLHVASEVPAWQLQQLSYRTCPKVTIHQK